MTLNLDDLTSIREAFPLAFTDAIAPWCDQQRADNPAFTWSVSCLRRALATRDYVVETYENAHGPAYALLCDGKPVRGENAATMSEANAKGYLAALRLLEQEIAHERGLPRPMKHVHTRVDERGALRAVRTAAELDNQAKEILQRIDALEL